MNNSQLRAVLCIFIAGIFLVLVAPFLFTRSLGLVDFSGTGTIGDTIGGITSPITSLIGSILVFYALQAQIDANKLVQIQFDQQSKDEFERKKLAYISEQINIIRNEVNEFTYSTTDTEYAKSGEKKLYKFNYTGLDAISKFVDSIKHYGEGREGDKDPFQLYPKLVEFYLLLEIINSFCDKIISENISDEDRNYFMSSLSYSFNSKIKPPFTANEDYRLKFIECCERCGKRHSGIPDKIFDMIDLITGKIE